MDLEFFTATAIIVGALVPLLSLLNQLIGLIAKGVRFVRERRIKRRLKGLIITPTVEEFARYGTSLPQPIDYAEDARESFIAQFIPAPVIDLISDEQQARMIIVMITTGGAFAFLAGRLIQVVLF